MFIALLALDGVVRGVRAEDAPPQEIPYRIERMGDAEVQRRLDFLVERLDAHRDYAWAWWTGWTTFYGLGVVVQGTRAGLSEGGKRADYIVSAVKATAGVATLLARPLEAKDGADKVRAVPDDTLEDRRRRLAVAEEQLRTNAEVSRRRYNPLRHMLNAGVNFAGGAIVAKGFGDPKRGWRSAAIGTAVGEVVFFTQPWWPANDWEEYERRFDETDPQVSWRVVPTADGIALRVDF